MAYTRKFWTPVLFAIVINVFVILVFLIEASFHHTAAARTPTSLLVLLPIPIALGPALGPLSLLLGLFQFPIYGILLGYANEKGKLIVRLLQIALVHGAIAAISVWVTSV